MIAPRTAVDEPRDVREETLPFRFPASREEEMAAGLCRHCLEAEKDPSLALPGVRCSTPDPCSHCGKGA